MLKIDQKPWIFLHGLGLRVHTYYLHIRFRSKTLVLRQKSGISETCCKDHGMTILLDPVGFDSSEIISATIVGVDSQGRITYAFALSDAIETDRWYA
jgi:hypothetical protein